jgi:cysteinyl-tRNA synthetase
MITKSIRKLGYDVQYVRNYTDIDDKIIQKALSENKTSEEISKQYIKEAEQDYRIAGMAEPTYKTLVSEHLPEIIDMIQNILDHKKAYVADDGEVLFSVRDFESYGKLSGRKLDDLDAGSRVEISHKKRDPLDFTLWKPAKPQEPSWQSPWGLGRPGWHIECSAMASKWLGNQIDLHHGARDLIFPHHENEIAQSEAGTGCVPFVSYWIHSGFLNMGSEKMSKSLGNITSARDFLTQYGGEFTRYLMLSVHYRAELEFNQEALDQTSAGLHRIYEAKKKALALKNLKTTFPDMRAEQLWGEFVQDVEKSKTAVMEHLANDFNTSGVLGELFTLIRHFNRLCSEPRGEQTSAVVLGAEALIRFLEDEVGAILGIGRLSPESVLEDLVRIRNLTADTSKEVMTQEKIEALILERLEARKNKNFAESDRIRDELLKAGVAIKDTPQGTTWSYQ